MRWHYTLILISTLFYSPTSFGGSISFRAGPQQVGNGGSYPMWIPPTGPDQYGLTWVTDSGFESTLSIYPGILFGKRFQDGGLFASVGGGIIIARTGGLGVYSTIGYETGSGSKGAHFTTDYTQAIGYAANIKKYQAPSSMRFGILWRY
jgi:hypothetical protein